MRRREHGFTLLEVVIAFTLLAAMLAVTLRLFSEGSSGVSRAERRTVALLHAESKLAEMLATAARPGRFAGNFSDGYQWQAILVPQREREPGDARQLLPLQVTVTVSAPGEDAARGVSLDTLHLSPAPKS